MPQNSGAVPPTNLPTISRRPSFLTKALGGSATLHAVLLMVLWLWPVPPEKSREVLLEVDLREPEKKLEAKPTPVPTPPKAQPTKPPVAKKPEPKPTPRLAKVPTPEPPKPKPTAETKKPEPKPTPEMKPTAPPKSLLAKVPTPAPKTEPKPTPEPAKKAANEPTPGLKDKTTRKDIEKAPEKFAGLERFPKPGDGAPKSPSKPRFDDNTGDLAGDRTPGAGRRDPGTRRNSRGSSSFDEAATNQPDTAGQNNGAQTPLPRGIATGQRLAQNNSLASGTLDNTNFGAGRDGGGSKGNFSNNAGTGSRTGKNPELAGTDGAGGMTLPRSRAKRGGGGGTDARFAILPRPDSNAIQLDMPSLTPGGGGGAGGGRGGGVGGSSGGGIGNMLAGAERGALKTRPGGGIGAGKGNGTGGAPGSGRGGGEEAGGGGGSGGGFGRGQGSGYGDGKGGSGGGGGRRKGRLAGDPFGDPNGSRKGDGSGGGGSGGGPGGPGKGPLLASRGGDGPGDGAGRGAGRGSGSGAGEGSGPGRGAGGFGRGPGAGAGKGSGDGGAPGIGGGNGGGGGGRGRGGQGGDDGPGNGDDNAGNGGLRGRPLRGRAGARREGDSESDIGRGIWGGFRIQYFQDTADHPDEPDATFKPGNPIDWPVFTKPIKTTTAPVLDFNWGTKPPAPGMRHTFWSLKAMGKIFVPKDDTYEFYFDELDDAGRLYLDGKKIIDVWLVQKSTPSSSKFFLKRGPHDLVIEYVQGPAVAASIKLAWKSSSFGKEVVGVYKPPD